MLFFTPTIVNIQAFKINAVDNGSVVNAGSVQVVDKLISYKRNHVLGEMNGDLSPINLPIAAIMDPDILDSTVAKNSAV